jgi:hypothetical protein
MLGLNTRRKIAPLTFHSGRRPKYLERSGFAKRTDDTPYFGRDIFGQRLESRA